MRNFLIGKGELLTEYVKPAKGGQPSPEVYTFAYAKNKLIPEIKKISNSTANKSEDILPGNLEVISLVMNPSYTSRSAFPSNFLREVGLEAIGSKSTDILPERWSKKKPVEPTLTTEIFVAGSKETILNLDDLIGKLPHDSTAAKDFIHIEMFKDFKAINKIKPDVYENRQNRYFEVGLHLKKSNKDFIISKFKLYIEKNNGILYEEYGVHAGNLWFVPIEIHIDQLESVASFSMVRLIRKIYNLRNLQPIRHVSSLGVRCQLSSLPPLSSEPKVALLDGGIPDEHLIDAWLTRNIHADELAENCLDSNDHGLGVTSAFLFGSIKPRSETSQPYSYVTHIRVLDKETQNDDPFELYRTLRLIQDVLVSKAYQFINLSLGPNLCISDDDVHPWTSLIDEELSDGRTLMTIAAGNNGELDAATGNNRIQVPSDSVNALVVGAINSEGNDWSRACYSALGPGRTPGRVKPDVVAFGGDSSEYFHILAKGKSSEVAPTRGTSFAAPLVLRQAVGIRALMGESISPLAIKALLIDTAHKANFSHEEVGWGRVVKDLAQIVECKDGQARILYQGTLEPGKFLRAEIPLPPSLDKGKVKIQATLAYTCKTDPEHVAAYTQAGLEVTFRPHEDKLNDNGTAVKTDTFFSTSGFVNEKDRKLKEKKWETVLRSTKTKNAKSLKRPTLDIHYVARENGGNPKNAHPIPYAMVITVESSVNLNLYNEILQTYLNILAPIRPKIDLPISI